MGSRSICATFLSLVLLGCVSPAAQAAYPGEPGRIAFDDGNHIFTMNSDGSDVVAVTDGVSPAWRPDGQAIGFAGSSGIVIVNPDGTSPQTVPVAGDGPAWSPDGLKVAYHTGGDLPDIFSVNLDGTESTMLTRNDEDCVCLAGRNSSWSPTGDEIAFEGRGMVDDLDGGYQPGNKGLTLVDASGFVYRWLGAPSNPFGSTYVDWSPDGTKLAFSGPPVSDPYNDAMDIYVVNADGSGLTNLTNSPQDEIQPAWSPDGAKIAFTSLLPPLEPWQCSSRQCNYEIHTMNADGSGVTRLTNNTTRDMKPSWQPVQRPYARPAGANPLRVSLVPAFAQCASENRIHGPPLAFPSCNPPKPASPSPVVSDGERRIGSVGYLRAGVIAGEPGGTDDADLRLIFRITNVMNKSDLSDYTGILQPELVVRITDREGFQSQTTQDFPFRYSVPCVATDAAVGGLCALTTSAEAIVPGSITEGSRAIWALDKVRVYDGGPAGDGANASLFATQGYFVP